MTDKKIRKVTVELSPVEMVWLHSQHLFQKIEEGSSEGHSQIKFFKNNSGVQIRFQGSEGDGNDLLRAREQLLKVLEGNSIRLISTSLHKDNYIRISKQARKEFPKSYIIFLHYETFENCCRKLQDKFNITSITPELEKLRKNNPYFCFLIAEKDKIDDIEKFTKRILHSEISCASTTFSHRREAPPIPLQLKRAMSVSSLRGSFSDQNQEQYRLSAVQNPVQEQLFQMSESILANLQSGQLQMIRQRGLYQGALVSLQRYQGTYSSLLKKLYYSNRLQLTANPYMQPIYGYNMMQKTPYNWCLTLLTDRKYHNLKSIWGCRWLLNIHNKIQLLLKIGRGLLILHRNMQTYCGLNQQTVLLDDDYNVYLSAVITKQILPHTNAFIFDIRHYLMLTYWLFTQCQISYEMIVFKQQNQEYFCTLSHKSKNVIVRQFMKEADNLFIGDIGFEEFVKRIEQLHEK